MMKLNKYLKYVLYLIPVLLLVYLGRKKTQISVRAASEDKLVPISPPHSHDYAYKRAYLNPLNENNENCRANPQNIQCTSSCMKYHYNFSECVHKQPKSHVLKYEDGKESDTEYVIKKLNYY